MNTWTKVKEGREVREKEREREKGEEEVKREKERKIKNTVFYEDVNQSQFWEFLLCNFGIVMFFHPQFSCLITDANDILRKKKRKEKEKKEKKKKKRKRKKS